MLVSGEAGQGKTRLSLEAAREAHDEGAVVLYGRCDPEVAVPYRPWVEMLGHWAAHATDAELDAVDPRHLAELARLVPSLVSATPGTTAAPPLDRGEGVAGDQYVLFGAVAGLLGVVSSDRPIVLILDDLHWADRGTVQLLRHVATSSPRSHLLILGTYRDTDVDGDHPVTDLVMSLHRDARLDRIELGGLDGGDVAALVEQSLPADAHALEERAAPSWSTGAGAVPLPAALHDETGGNPFFVGELLRHLAGSGSVARDPDRGWVLRVDLGEAELPTGVRELVAARVRGVGERAGEVLAAASVLGRDFDVATLASVLGEDPDEVYGFLEPAVAGRLVVELDGTGDRMSFVHSIVHHSLYLGLTSGRRARLHRRAADVLEHEAAGASPRRYAEQVAHHLFAGLPPAELERAVPAAERAAECAVASSAPDEAVHWLRRALDVVEATDPPDERRRGRLLVRLGDAERDAGAAGFREHLLIAAGIARDLDDHELLVDAAIANHRGLAASETGAVDLDRVAVLEAALQVVGSEDRPERALVLAGLAGELIFSGQDRRFDLVREAVEVARRTGDHSALVRCIHRGATVTDVPRWFDQRHRWIEEGLALTDGDGEPVGRFLILTVAVRDALTFGDLQAAERHAAEAHGIATEVGRPVMLWHSEFLDSMLALTRGVPAESERLAEHALHIGSESGQPDALLIFGAQLMMVRWHQGRMEELVDLLLDTSKAHPDMPVYTAALAYVQSVSGDPASARTRLAELTDQGFPFPDDWNWGLACALAAQAAHELHDADAARLLHDMLSPHRHLVIATGSACLPAVTHLLGLLAATLGRLDEAASLLEEALARHDALGAPFLRALTRMELARLVGERDPQRAGALVLEAQALAERHGYGGLRHDAASG